MQKLISRAHPVAAVILDVLLIYSLGKEIVEDIMNRRKNHNTTTTKDESPTEQEPATT